MRNIMNIFSVETDRRTGGEAVIITLNELLRKWVRLNCVATASSDALRPTKTCSLKITLKEASKQSDNSSSETTDVLLAVC